MYNDYVNRELPYERVDFSGETGEKESIIGGNPLSALASLFGKLGEKEDKEIAPDSEVQGKKFLEKLHLERLDGGDFLLMLTLLYFIKEGECRELAIILGILILWDLWGEESV